MPGTCGRCRLRPLPAHSSVFTMAWVSNLDSSARVRVNGFSTSPAIVRRQSSALSVLGSCMWLRTKKCGTGVSQVLKNSTGVSRSTKRKERTIKPSSPGRSMDPLWAAVAHEEVRDRREPGIEELDRRFQIDEAERTNDQTIFAGKVDGSALGGGCPR